MKFKTTKKEITSNFDKILGIGYCGLQHLLYYQNPIAYTCGVYGWYADIYNINGVIICTGYCPFGNIRADYNLTKEYDEKARQITNDRNKSYEQRKEEVNSLLNEFIEKIKTI